MRKIALSHPDFLQYWNYTKNSKLPGETACGSDLEIWWKCKNGHEWKTSPYSYLRIKNAEKCPICRFNNRPTISKDCPELLKYWNYEKNIIDPIKTPLCSHSIVWWKCKNGHEWKQEVFSRTKRIKTPKCTVCRSVGFLFPLLARDICQEKNAIDPFKLLRGSIRKIWWKCENGHTWRVSVGARTYRPSAGCPICRRYKKDCITDEKLIKEWDYSLNNSTPEKTPKFSKDKIHWICSSCKNKWIARSDSRTEGRGCPKCQSVRYPKKKSLAIVANHILKEFNYEKNFVNPENISFRSNVKVWWKCKNGHEWYKSPNDRLSAKIGCPICNSLAFKNPELIKEWHENNSFLPAEISYGSGKKAWWICSTCSHEWQATISSRSKGVGCPACCKNVELIDGTKCDSITEAYFYLKYKNKGLNFRYNKKYPNMGKHRYDFYFPSEDLYIEVTSYHNKSERFVKYMKNIEDKKNHVEKVLGSNFKFIKYSISKKERLFVKKFIIKYNVNTGAYFA